MKKSGWAVLALAALVAGVSACRSVATPRSPRLHRLPMEPATPSTLAITAPEDGEDAWVDRGPAPRPLSRPTRFSLPNGLNVVLLTTPAPGAAVALRLVLPGAGSAQDDEHPGAAHLTASLLRESFSGSLRMETKISFDATEFAVVVSTDKLPAVLQTLATGLRRPPFESTAFAQVRRAERAARERVAEDDVWTTTRLLHQELFRLPTTLHPYEFWDVTTADLDGLSLEKVRKFHTKNYTSTGATLVVVGPVNERRLRSASKGLATWKGAEVRAVAVSDPLPPRALRVLVVDQPQATRSQVVVAALLPASHRDAPWFPLLSALLTGGPGGGRLGRTLSPFLGRGPVVTAETLDVAEGSVPLVLRAIAPSAEGARVAAALLGELDQLGAMAPTDRELAAAWRTFVEGAGQRRSTPAGAAAELAREERWRRSDQAVDVQRLPAQGGETLRQELGPALEGGRIVIVSGNAAVVAPLLTRWGDVVVVTPARGFERYLWDKSKTSRPYL